jgi:MFS family permease
MGLPISVEFFCVGIAILISGFWNDRRGWHEPFLTGIFLAATGGIYSWIAPDVLNFIISRALVGIGYGLMLLAAQGFVIAYTDETNRTQGLAQFLAGLYAGSICGGATGALAGSALRLSFSFPFWCNYSICRDALYILYFSEMQWLNQPPPA